MFMVYDTGRVMQCYDYIKGRSIKIEGVGQTFDRLKFNYADIGLSVRQKKSALMIAYGNCEKF